jgi:hypothetical protein
MNGLGKNATELSGFQCNCVLLFNTFGQRAQGTLATSPGQTGGLCRSRSRRPSSAGLPLFILFIAVVEFFDPFSERLDARQ